MLHFRGRNGIFLARLHVHIQLLEMDFMSNCHIQKIIKAKLHCNKNVTPSVRARACAHVRANDNELWCVCESKSNNGHKKSEIATHDENRKRHGTRDGTQILLLLLKAYSRNRAEVDEPHDEI